VLQHSYNTDNSPIRLSYHNNMHYNSVVDPYSATVGVGLGLPDLKPGMAEKSLIKDGVRTSETFYIEQAMFEDKVRETDWQATNDAINDAVLRESQLQFLKDQEQPRCGGASADSNNTSSCRSPQWTASASSSSSALCLKSGGISLKPYSTRGSKPSSPAHTPSPPPCADYTEFTGTSSHSRPAPTTCSTTSPRFSSEAIPPRLASPATASAGLPCEYAAQFPEAASASASNQEYMLMKVLVESQIEYYNSLRRQHSPQPSSPEPGPSSAVQ
jgi:OTU domain-containing protein 5